MEGIEKIFSVASFGSTYYVDAKKCKLHYEYARGVPKQVLNELQLKGNLSRFVGV